MAPIPRAAPVPTLLALAVAAAPPAHAQRSGDEIVVTGQRGMLAGSIARQRGAEIVESVLTRDAIGQFPDQNVAEATRRLPGVNVLNDQGEGRFIAVRGLDPTLNAASVNGTRLPAPEADTRAVALDVVPSELVDSIEVEKTLTPDMDADTLGAVIEINTTSAFARSEPFFSASGEWSHNDLNGEGSPKAGVDFAYPVSERFGIAGGVSYNERKTSTDNIEMGGWSETDGGIVFAEDLEFRDYDVIRERAGASLSLDFRPGDATTLNVRTLYSRFDDEEQRRRLIFGVEEPSGGGSGFATFLSEDGEIGVERDLKDRFESQEVQSSRFGGTSVLGAWSLEYEASASRASEREFRTQDPTTFARGFEDPGELLVQSDYRDLERPRYRVALGNAAFGDPAEYEFDGVERVDGLAEDEQETLAVHAVRRLGGGLELQLGGKVRSREKRYDLTVDVFDGFAGDYTLADVAGAQTYGLADLGPLPSRDAVRAFFAANAASFELDDAATAFESNVADLAVDEDIDALYGLVRWSSDRSVLVAGVRGERTRDDVRGHLVELVEEGGTRNGIVLDEDAVFVTPNAFANDYRHWLPSVNWRHELADDVLLRVGAFKSVVRPNMSALAPRFVVEENRGGDRQGEFGNPALDPYDASNLDVSVEWYFAENAVLQGGLFYKVIDDFIVDVTYEAGDAPFNGVFNGVAFDEAVIPRNGEEATVVGLELNYQHALANGLLFGCNYTYTDAEGELSGRTIPLPAASKNNANVTAGYENGRFSLRLTAAYRDLYLDELGSDAEEDRYVKEHLQWDLSAKYRVTDAVQLYADFVNVGDEPYVAYQRFRGADRLLQYEEYSWTGKLGVRVSF
jgi:TonB-dependent receptor